MTKFDSNQREELSEQGTSGKPATDVSPLRRNLLKGAMVAPIVTLQSGSAMALVSAYQCLARDAQVAAQAGGTIPVWSTSDSGPWVRVTIPGTSFRRLFNSAANATKDTFTDGPSANIKATSGTSVAPLVVFYVPQSPLGGAYAGKWLLYTAVESGDTRVGALQVFTDATSGVMTSAGKNYYFNVAKTYVQRYLTVVVDPNSGVALALGKNSGPSGATLITGSCWCSVNPGLNVV